MAQIITESVKADSLQATEANLGNVIVSGKARFVQPVYAELENTINIHNATTNQSPVSTDYVFISRNITFYCYVFFCNFFNNKYRK